jgi:hypothetical protein
VLLVPYSLIVPFVGVFLDRWSRRSILFVANLLRALMVVPAALLIRAGDDGALFLLLAFLIIGLNRFFLAGVSAAMPHVVDDRRLVTANSIAGTLGSVFFSLGLGCAFLALRTVVSASFEGYALIASCALIGYAASALLARWSFDDAALGPDVRPADSVLAGLAHTGREVIAGLRHLSAQQGAAYAMLAQAAHRVMFGVLALATVLLVRGHFHQESDVSGSISGLAGVFAAGILGVLAGAFLTPPVARRVGGWRWIAGLLAFEGVAVFAFGLPFRPLALMVAVFAVNLAAQGIKIVVETDLQHECADEYRGRVFSVNDTVFNVAFVLGLFGAALVLPPDGRSVAALVVVTVVFIAVAVWYTAVGGRWARQVGDDIAEPERSAAHVTA